MRKGRPRKKPELSDVTETFEHFPHIHIYIYLISNLIQKLWDIFGFFVAGVSVVGVAYR